ncbi:catalase family peroxidase [Oleiagrimonas sp. C23AA]|uniref:catalase family peroxidase n=1 Tax=Oleiagrimonas sp. C23AA TaxID=2719047 RepID=UPI00198133E6|nr:catalase family peroxidase [Oleiagrimonas sp. C23AA]
MTSPSSSRPGLWRWALVIAPVLLVLLIIAYVAGWLSPHRLTPDRFINQFQTNGGVHPGLRRNHAKGVCVAGYFQGNDQASVLSRAALFADVRTPVVGRFSLPGPNPLTPDGSTPVRAMALRFALANGQQWRTAMLNAPVFSVNTPQAFYQNLVAHAPDAHTGKPDKAKIAAFNAAHPEMAPFMAWAKATVPSASFATQNYGGLDAFYVTNARGQRHAVRWRFVPQAKATDPTGKPDANALDADLMQRLANGPLRWQLVFTVAQAGDPTAQAATAWPADRKQITAGTLVLTRASGQAEGPCRDINYDPTILPDGMSLTDDPLPPARSAAYADSFRRRTAEEAHLPGYPAAKETH